MMMVIMMMMMMAMMIMRMVAVMAMVMMIMMVPFFPKLRLRNGVLTCVVQNWVWMSGFLVVRGT